MAAIQTEVLRTRGRDILVVTDPTCRLVNPLEAQWSIPIFSMCCRAKVMAAMTALGPKECYGRGETRIREDNTWLIDRAIAPKIHQWSLAVLPRGKRAIVVFPAKDAADYWIEVLDRDTLAPANGQFRIGSRRGMGMDTALDCIVTPDCHLFVFDAIYVNGNSVCSLPLAARMSSVPDMPDLYTKLEYSPAAGAFSKAIHITRASGERLLFVDSLAQYRANSKSAMTWRPPRAPDTAILCVRCGSVMAAISREEAWLIKVGDVMPSSVYKHMGAYVCSYDRAKKTWAVGEMSKRKEPLSTYWLVDNIISGNRRVLDGPEIFKVLDE